MTKEGSLKANALKEFSENPIRVTLAIVGPIVGAVMYCASWFGQDLAHPVTEAETAIANTPDKSIFDVLRVVGFFLVASFSASSCIRMLAKYSPFSAVVLSVPAAALVGFFAISLLHMTPYRVAANVAVDLAFYGVMLIFISMNGWPVVRDLLKQFAIVNPPSSGDTETSKKSSEFDATGFLIAIGIMLLVWSMLVHSGMTKLVNVFLIAPVGLT